MALNFVVNGQKYKASFAHFRDKKGETHLRGLHPPLNGFTVCRILREAPDEHPVGGVPVERRLTTVAEGVAWCYHTDPFNKREGRKKAFRRAIERAFTRAQRVAARLWDQEEIAGLTF
jgi:hypothetical protein